MYSKCIVGGTARAHPGLAYGGHELPFGMAQGKGMGQVELLVSKEIQCNLSKVIIVKS